MVTTLTDAKIFSVPAWLTVEFMSCIAVQYINADFSFDYELIASTLGAFCRFWVSHMSPILF